MTDFKHRRSVPDRARRRAIRAHAARLGVPYSVAARLLTGRSEHRAGPGAGCLPPDGGEHRAWLFAMRERRSFDLRVRDTRLAADLPLGRAEHLAERFPPLRGPGGTFYDGDSRQALLAMLYAVLAHESPASVPARHDLAWVAELGEEGAVDTVCAGLDRAARLLLDGDSWRLWTRIEATVVAGAASPDQRIRQAAMRLGGELRGVVPRRCLPGARHTLDALLVADYGRHTPGTRVRIRGGLVGTVVGVRWAADGPPTGYEVRLDDGTTLSADPDGVGPLDDPVRA